MTFGGPAKPTGAAAAVVALIVIAQANQDRGPCPECDGSHWVSGPDPGTRVPCMNSHHGTPIA